MPLYIHFQTKYPAYCLFLLETLAHEEHQVETYKKSIVEFKNRRVLVGGALKSQKVTLS
jgi:hypothetical protein